MRVIEKQQTKYYWWNDRKGLFPKEYNNDQYNHISFIINNEELFNLEKGYCEKVYAEFDEPLRFEGKARQIIINKVLKDNWIRLRRWVVDYTYNWYIELNNVTNRNLLRKLFSDCFELFKSQDKIIILDSKNTLDFNLNQFSLFIEKMIKY